MFNFVKTTVDRCKGWIMGGAVAASGVMASAASAQFVPEEMDPITFPITLSTIAIAIGTAGAAVLVIVFGWKGGFKMVGSLFHSLLKASRG